MEYIQKHVLEAPIPINQRVPGLQFPDGVWLSISRALSKAPADRFQSAIEFGAALRPFAGVGPLVDSIFQMNQGPNFVAPLPIPGASVSLDKSGNHGVSARKSSTLTLVLVAGVFLLLGAGIAVLVLLLLSKR
jgi:hypothetical protein